MSNTRKVALITGCSRGLGAALVNRFWAEEYSVLSLSKSESNPQLQNLQPIVAGQFHRHVRCDLKILSDIPTALDELLRGIKVIDVLVNNAAIHGPIGPLEQQSSQAWTDIYNINLFAPVELCRAALPFLKNASNGAIINISGGGAADSRPFFSAYASSKAALVRFSECLADELSEQKISVNCVAPGAMNTDLLQEIVDLGDAAGSKEAAVASAIVSDVNFTFEPVCDLVHFLSKPKSVFLTGMLISAKWDNWHLLNDARTADKMADVFKLRRVVGADRNLQHLDR